MRSFFFFFQAEDGIRDPLVTGVQTCALPIFGVTAEGTKVPLGVVEGSTENATVVRGLISNLRDRGLDVSQGVLFAIDGAKALAKAIDDVFGGQAVIARCRVHKERNVLDHLPEAERRWVRRKLRAAWANPDAAEAEAALTALA